MTDQISFPPLLDLSPGELQAHKQHLVSEIAQQPERRRLSWPSARSSRLRLAVVAVGLIAAAAVGFGLSSLVQGSGRQRSGPAGNQGFGPNVGGPGALRPGITTLGNDNPFGDAGKLVTLQQFVADMANRGYNVPLPDSPLANSNNVGNVWENTDGEVIVYYPSSGIELNYGGTGVDYTGVPADEIQEINGVRAIVVPKQGPDSYFTEVMLPLPSGHLVTLLSNGPVSDLVSVAKTMQSALPAEPPHFLPIDLNFTRGDQGITSIGVTINASTLGGTALIQVVRVVGADISETSRAGGKVVFQEQVPMTDLASPKSGPPGTEPLSSWSGSLSPSDWDGGCQKAKYVITTKVSPANPTPEARGAWAESGMFICGSTS
jgi:hypothetical protein